MPRLAIDSLAAGGEGVARAEDGRVVFVDGAVPGDEVEVELTEQKARFARGRVTCVVRASADRVTPPCPHAGTCGGCPWQIVAPPAQRAAKQAIVARALSRLPVEVAQIVAAPADLGYRLRATQHAQGGAIGFHARRSHALVAVHACVALVPELDEALRVARAHEGGVLAGALGEGGALRGTVGADDAVQLAFDVGRGADEARLAAIARALVGQAGITGVLVGGQAFGAALIDGGGGHWVSARGFRQANLVQNDRLRALVGAALQADGARVLELYAGDGNFTRDLVGRAAHVLAIEEDRGAIERLRRSLPGVEAEARRVEDAVARRRGERWERILLDPPREGAKAAMRDVAALAASRIVYVSCDPATLARDAAVLVGAGYRLEGATPIDLMPHTDHVEVVLVAVHA